MKIHFLGTSHGVPEKTRFCSSTMIEANGRYYIFDAGAPICNLLIRKDITPDKIDAIFITHQHGDHTNGLYEFVDLISWSYTKAKTKIYVPDQSGKDVLIQSNKVANGEGIPQPFIDVFHEGEVFDDGNVKVSAYRNMHTAYSYGFLIEAEGKRIVITGDLGNPHVDMTKPCFEKHCDAVICEAAHFNLLELKDLFDEIDTDKIIFNHVAPRNEPRFEELIKLDNKAEMILSYDGMVTVI